jgi:hypothetical protein
MATILKALSFRSYGAGFLSSAYLTHSLSKRARCEPLSTTSSSLTNNPLMNKKSTPLFAEIKSEHILPAIDQDLAALKSGFLGYYTPLPLF